MFCVPTNFSIFLMGSRSAQTILHSLPWDLIEIPRSLPAYQTKTILRCVRLCEMLFAHANAAENISDSAAKHHPTTKTFCDSLLKKGSTRYPLTPTPLFL